MNSPAAVSTAHRPHTVSVRTVFAAWRGITRKQVMTTFLLGCGFFIYRSAVTINLEYAQYIFVGTQINVFGLLLAFVAADRITGKDPDRRGAYVLAALICAAVSVPLSILVVWSLIRFFVPGMARSPIAIGFALNIYFELLMVGGATIWVINDRRRARRARAQMHAAELQRIAAQRRSIESELQVMQARIEPQFLFNTLAQVRQLFIRNEAAGEVLLDALIAYLRAAMPMTHGTSSVRQEFALVRAYLSMARLRMGERLAFSIETIADQVADARMPAMILLPLVDHAIAHGPADWQATASIRIRAAVTLGGASIEIVGIGVDFTPETEGGGVAGVRGRLASLYGLNAELLVERREAGESVLTLNFPLDLSGTATVQQAATET